MPPKRQRDLPGGDETPQEKFAKSVRKLKRNAPSASRRAREMASAVTGGPDATTRAASEQVGSEESTARAAKVPEAEGSHFDSSPSLQTELSKLKTSTLLWVVGIVSAAVLSIIVAIFTMDSSYRSEMRERTGEIKADMRRDLDRIDGGLNRVVERIDSLQARVNQIPTPPATRRAR